MLDPLSLVVIDASAVLVAMARRRCVPRYFSSSSRAARGPSRPSNPANRSNQCPPAGKRTLADVALLERNGIGASLRVTRLGSGDRPPYYENYPEHAGEPTATLSVKWPKESTRALARSAPED